MHKIALVFLSFIIMGCISYSVPRVQKEDLVGVWLLEDYGVDKYSHSLLGFLPDGTKCVVSYSFSSEDTVEFDYYFNKYILDENILVSTVSASSTEYLYPGYELRDEIKTLTNYELTLVMIKPIISNPRLEKHVRLKNENPERICSLVKEKLKL